MLICVYRTLSSVINFRGSCHSNINLVIMYAISRDLYMVGDARQMVLDLLIWIKSYMDRTLSFRSSCCEGVCGSCAMLINNTNTLACIQPIWLIHSYVIMYPLPHFNVVRDLVIDLKCFYEQYAYVNPFYNLYDTSGFSDTLYCSYIFYVLCYRSFLLPYVCSLPYDRLTILCNTYLVLLYSLILCYDETFINIHLASSICIYSIISYLST